jgi:ubiquinone/menaquinone biosynthesis C-methylase UbiE
MTRGGGRVMVADPSQGLSDRQRRELEYHREYAEKLRPQVEEGVVFDITTSRARRWWNAYWHAHTRLRQADLADKRALVVGCGFGDDAIRLTKLGARVSAFDLSPESLAIARSRASRFAERPIDFQQMPAEKLTYPSDSFDAILAVDILHHVDIPSTIKALHRVARPGCLVVCNEPYTHSSLQRIRESRLVEANIYPLVLRWMRGAGDRREAYITEDERKLGERELGLLSDWLSDFTADYFNSLSGRVIPERFVTLSKGDRLGLRLLRPLAPLLAGRVVVSGRVAK